LAAATVAIYAQVLQFQFVSWDDPGYIYENPHIAQGVTKSSLAWAFTSGYAANWHPLTWISHMVDVQLFGLERGPGDSFLHGPGGHHLVSVLLHTANSLLLLLLIYRMTGDFWPSALTAALFALHPLRVESVAWVSERKDVLSGLFFMFTLLSYHAYTQRPTLRRYLLVFISLALGLMAKPMLVTVPFVLLLIDLWPLRRWEHPAGPPRQILLEKLPLLALVIASCLITIYVQKAAGAVVPLDRLPWAWRLVNTPVAYVMYLLKTLWPSHLAYAYPHPANIFDGQLGEWIALAGVASGFLVLVSVVAWRRARQQPFLLVGWLWFLGMLLPVIGLMQVGNQAWADRYAYLPLVGVYLALSGSLSLLVRHRPALRPAVIAVATTLLLVLLTCTWRQAGVWRDSRSLFEHAIAVTRSNFEARNNLGDVLARSGQHREAVEQFQQSLSIKPDFAKAHSNLGVSLASLGHPREAVMQHEEALRLKPDLAGAHYNLAAILQERGEFEEAITRYRRALAIDPDHAEAHNNLGVCLSKSGRSAEAAGHYQEALRLKPDYAEAHNNLGIVFVERGQFVKALKSFEHAARLKPEFAGAHDNVRKAREMLRENSKSRLRLDKSE
jgi:tetratricopeptide (TPR) repeat protein